MYQLGVPPHLAEATGAIGPGIVVVGAAQLRPLAWWAVAEIEARSIALSPDRRYLYLATDARSSSTQGRSVGVAVHDASAGDEIAHAPRLPVVAGARLDPVVVR